MKLILNLKPWQRSILALIACAATYFILKSYKLNTLFDVAFSWCAFASVYMILNWMVIFKRKTEDIRKMAREDDGSAVYVFFLIFLASVASFFVVLLLTTSEDSELKKSAMLIPASVGSMILAWFVIHTQYIFHYAHEYYDEDDNGDKEQVGGLDFPNDDKPDYLDFAYYSLCMGCTFQVSDVSTTSKLLRRITMFHGLLSFFINTFVVALTINLVAGIGGK